MIGQLLRTGTETISKSLHAVGWTPRVRAVGDLRVVLYHGIGDASHPAMRHLDDEIPLDVFARQLDYLETHYEIVRLEDGITRAAHAARPRCAITFDDGLRSVATGAAPELQRRGLPAAVFLNTSVVGTTAKLWQHQLSALIVRDGLDRILARLRAMTDGPADFADGLSVIDFVQHHFAECASFLAWIETQDTGHDRLYLDWSEVATLAGRGLDFYSHTARHLPLDRVPADVMRAEIDAAVEAMTNPGTKPSLISFPFGMESDFGRAARSYALTKHSYAIEVEDGWNPLPRVLATRTVRRVALGDARDAPSIYATIELLPIVKGSLTRLIQSVIGFHRSVVSSGRLFWLGVSIGVMSPG